MLKTEEKSTSEKHVKKSKKEPELSLLQEVEAGQPEMFSDNVEASDVFFYVSNCFICDCTGILSVGLMDYSFPYDIIYIMYRTLILSFPISFTAHFAFIIDLCLILKISISFSPRLY